MIYDEDDLVRRIVLLEESGKVFAKTLIQSPAGHDYRGEGREIRKWTGDFNANVSTEAEAAAKGKHAKANNNESEEIENRHIKLRPDREAGLIG